MARNHYELPPMTVAVFPQLNFKCSGMIEKVYFLAKSGTGRDVPLLTLWESGEPPPTGIPIFDPPKQTRNTSLSQLKLIMNDSVTGVGLYEQTVNLRFMAEEMIGFTQPQNSSMILQYLNQTGETLLNQANSIPQNLRLFPLIGIETSKLLVWSCL